MLMVEDDERTLEQVPGVVRSAIPELQVDLSASIVEAKERIIKRYHANERYDVVVLDFMLPLIRGDVPAFDETLCALCRQRASGALIAHITAYAEDEIVTKHNLDYHSDVNDQRSLFLPKTPEYCELLVSRMQRFLYSSHVRSQIEALFPILRRSSALRGLQRSSISNVGKLDVTQQLSILSCDISKYWQFLDEALKGEIKEQFRVIEAEELVRISLL